MSTTIPSSFLDLFSKQAFAHLATVMSDGRPQVTPVWCDYDGTHVLVNTAKDRVKERNMRRNPNVALDITDPDNPYRYLAIQGRVVEVTQDGADEHIDRMAKKYLGKDKYPFRAPGEVRILAKIAAERVHAYGG